MIATVVPISKDISIERKPITFQESSG